MGNSSSRRNFLAAGLALPAAGAAAVPRGMAAGAAAPEPAKGPALKYRTLGRTGLKVTEVGFGCMITSDPTVIEAAADVGINFFDTARGYQDGNNERMVGAALKSKRRNIILCTKSNSHSAAQAREHLETSLRELGTDYIDVWYLHSRSKPEQISDELLEVQAAAKKEGKVRFTGFTTHSGQKELLKAWAGKPMIDVILVAYNFTMDQAMAEAVADARKTGTAIVGMKVMAGGFRRVKPGNPLHERLSKAGTMLAALKWVLNDRNVDTTIPSITDMEQLEENLRAMAENYTDEDRRLLAWQSDEIRPLYCRMCGACEGKCPKGLPVSDMIRYLSYAEGYGQFPLGRASFLELPEEVRAVRCGDCADCVIRCPNGVHVAERLRRAQEIFA